LLIESGEISLIVIEWAYKWNIQALPHRNWDYRKVIFNLQVFINSKH